MPDRPHYFVQLSGHPSAEGGVLGSRDQLTTGGEEFDLELAPYGAELRRRWQILFPKPPAALPKQDGQERPLFQRVAGQALATQRPAPPR